MKSRRYLTAAAQADGRPAAQGPCLLSQSPCGRRRSASWARAVRLQRSAYEDKTALFTLMAKKVLFLINEQPEKELTFFYTAAAL